MHCPSVANKLKDRTCSKCHLYFASKKAVSIHLKSYHQNDDATCSRIRPINVISRRNDEVLCLLGSEDGEDIEWIDVDDIVATENTDVLLANEDSDSSIPVIENLQEFISSPWTTE